MTKTSHSFRRGYNDAQNGKHAVIAPETFAGQDYAEGQDAYNAEARQAERIRARKATV